MKKHLGKVFSVVFIGLVFFGLWVLFDHNDKKIKAREAIANEVHYATVQGSWRLQGRAFEYTIMVRDKGLRILNANDIPYFLKDGEEIQVMCDPRTGLWCNPIKSQTK